MTLPPAPILIASDLSPRSDRALARGIVLARAHACPVIVFTAIDSALPEDMASDMAERARARLAEQIDPLAKDDVQVTIETHVGDPGDDIIDRITRLEPRLLVMGTHRRRAFFDLVRETTMQRIVRQSDCTALLVADPAEARYQRIVLATDFSPAAASVLRAARDLVAEEAHVVAIHALHIPYAGQVARSPELMAELETSFRKDAIVADAAWRAAHDLSDIPETRIVTAPIRAVLEDQATRAPHTLLAVGAHGRVGANRAVLGSVAVDLLRSPPCDVLIARP